MSILTQFKYPQKNKLAEIADFLLIGPRNLYGSKTVHCYRLNKQTATFVVSRPIQGELFAKAIKIAAFAITLLMSPFLGAALVIKKLDGNEIKVLERFCRRSSHDNFWKEHIFTHNPLTKFIDGIIMRVTGLDELTFSMQIHGDKILRKIAPWRYEGGHLFPIADLMLKKVCPMTNHDDPQTALDCQKVKSVLEGFVDLSKKMTFLTYSRIVSLKYLFNPDAWLEDLAEDVAEDLRRLPSKGVYLIPLTFYTHSRGFRHITTSVRRIKKNHFEWRIFRADLGDEGNFRGQRPTQICEMVVRGITLDQMTNKNFLIKLLRYGTAKKHDQGQRFFKFLRKFEEANENIFITDGKTRKKLPFSDIFSLKTINFALKELLGSAGYKKFMFLLKLKDLAHLKKKIKKHQIKDLKKEKHAKSVLSHAQKALRKRYMSLDEGSWLLSRQKTKKKLTFLKIANLD